MAYKVMCGVPRENCSGGKLLVNAGLRSAAPKGHNTHSEAYKCRRRHLLNQGWVDIGSRTFRPPPGVNDGYLMVLTKKSRFGARVRTGKLGDRYMPQISGRSGVVVG